MGDKGLVENGIRKPEGPRGPVGDKGASGPIGDSGPHGCIGVVGARGAPNYDYHNLSAKWLIADLKRVLEEHEKRIAAEEDSESQRGPEGVK